MKKFSVTKFFGHFRQTYHVTAESREDAWERAEVDGKLVLQSCYREPVDKESKGYVMDLEKQKQENPAVPDEVYYTWMREAICKGMKVSPDEYVAALGRLFPDKERI